VIFLCYCKFQPLSRMALLMALLSCSALQSEKRSCCELLPRRRCSSQEPLARRLPGQDQAVVLKAVPAVVCALWLGGEGGGAGVCAEGWAHPRIIGSITTVTLGVVKGC
jgi:hypothetical protein